MSSKKSKSAFSLIELSIVLIIIGLLVAGVTGGASLIASARVRALMGEINDYINGPYAFVAAEGRLPGNINRSGKIGHGSGETYTASSFPAPYDGTNANYSIPNELTAPFVDMYLAGILTFRPLKSTTTPTDIYGTYEIGGLPRSRVYSDLIIHYQHIESGTTYATNMENVNVLGVRDISQAWTVEHAKIFQNIDLKMDDGIYNEGIVRGSCDGVVWGNSSYEDGISSKKGCLLIFYNLKL